MSGPIGSRLVPVLPSVPAPVVLGRRAVDRRSPRHHAAAGGRPLIRPGLFCLQPGSADNPFVDNPFCRHPVDSRRNDPVVFKKMMRAFGVGGPSVDTVLANPNTRPGLTLGGQVQVVGGDHDVTVEHIALGLVTRIESGPGDGLVEFCRVPVCGSFRLATGERRDIPFSFPVPWETPVTDVYGRRLPGMTMGLRTELAVAKAVDKGDLDEVAVHPLPAQERILDAFGAHGFRFARADLEHGAIYGLLQELPFYQEIEFSPPPHLAAAINEVELTFVADPSGVEVVLEFDKRGGFLAPGRDAYGRFRVGHEEADTADWTAVVDAWIQEAVGRYQGIRDSRGYRGASDGVGAPGGVGVPGGQGVPGE
jgi:sporulation-control protein